MGYIVISEKHQQPISASYGNMDVPTTMESPNWSSTASNDTLITDDIASVETLFKHFAHLLWIDYLGFALQFCFTCFGSFINGLLIWVLSSCPGRPSLVDLVQMHMAAADIMGAVVTSILLCISRVVLMHDVVEGFRFYAFFCISHSFTMNFEDICTMLISFFRFKQVKS